MTRIELIGIKSAVYEDIKSSIVSYIEINKINATVVENNDLDHIIARNYNSIPLVLLEDEALYFNNADHVTAMQLVLKRLSKYKEKEKEHDCRNCGKCRCPKD